MADNEIELSARFGIPSVLGMEANVAASYKRTWSSRSREQSEAVSRHAGISVDELADALQESDTARDAYWVAQTRALDVADPEYRDALARLAAAALDNAKIDEAGLALAQLTRLEPAHLRALKLAVVFAAPPHFETLLDHPVAGAQISRRPFRQPLAVSTLGVSEATTFAILRALENENLLEIDHSSDNALRKLTHWGETVLALLFHEHDWSGRPAGEIPD